MPEPSSIFASRDRLFDFLGDQPTVKSVGITKQNGRLALLVLISAGSQAPVPDSFDGIPVITQVIDDATAHAVA
jgi:hypothetical protein